MPGFTFFVVHKWQWSQAAPSLQPRSFFAYLQNSAQVYGWPTEPRLMCKLEQDGASMGIGGGAGAEAWPAAMTLGFGAFGSGRAPLLVQGTAAGGADAVRPHVAEVRGVLAPSSTAGASTCHDH